jgi:hypothetical protein
MTNGPAIQSEWMERWKPLPKSAWQEDVEFTSRLCDQDIAALRRVARIFHHGDTENTEKTI